MELVVIALWLSLAALLGAGSLARLLLALVAAYLVVEVLLRSRLAPRLTKVVREQRGLLALAAVVPVVVLSSRAASLGEAEGLRELGPRLADRLRLAPAVSIAPPLVLSDRPQTFFVRAEGAHVTARFGEGGPSVAAVSLGHGVFRVDLDPRRDGALPRGSEGQLVVELEVDGSTVQETLAHVSPLAHPRRPASAPGGRALCVTSEETDELGAGLPGALERHATADGPVGCAFSGERVLIAARYAETLEVLERGSVAPGPAVGRGAVAIAADEARAVVLRDGEQRELVVLDAASLRVTGRLVLAGVPLSVVLVGDGLAAVATRSPSAILLVSLEGAPAVVRERALVMPATALASSPDGADVVLATTDFQADGRENLGNHYIEDQLVWLSVSTLAARRIEATARRTERQDHAGDLDRGLSPVGLSFDREGALLVAFAGSHEVARFPLDAPPRYAELSTELVVPTAILETDEGYAVVSPTSGLVLALDRELGVRAIDRWAPSDAELLRTEPSALQLRYGERSFWEGTRAGASCQSCHPDGSTDGEAHNIGGRVLAPTLDVRGLAGTAPFLRDGSYPYLGDLHEVAELEYRGYRAPAGDRHATLEAWLASLPLPPSFAPRDLERERRGLDAFFDAGCERCHAPPAFTTMARYAAHTVFPDAHLPDPALGLDLPSLRNLRGNEPYLFDGRARTLREVLTTANATYHHGDTSSLEPAELDDLVFFLETL